MICRRSATVQFWNGYAKWYKLWMKHSSYHDRIIEALTTMVKPKWRVLDIGAGNGVLSLPLCAIECDVTSLEPSVAMKSLLYEEAFKRGIDRIKVDGRRWEDVPSFEFQGYDLIMACNSLHLTETGFGKSLEKIFRAGPRHVFLITEFGPPEIKVRWKYEGYRMLFANSYKTEGSFAYHNMDEIWEHWAFKKGRRLCPDETMDIMSRVVFENGLFRLKETAYVGMYWWERSDDR